MKKACSNTLAVWAHILLTTNRKKLVTSALSSSMTPCKIIGFLFRTTAIQSLAYWLRFQFPLYQLPETVQLYVSDSSFAPRDYLSCTVTLLALPSVASGLIIGFEVSFILRVCCSDVDRYRIFVCSLKYSKTGLYSSCSSLDRLMFCARVINVWNLACTTPSRNMHPELRSLARWTYQNLVLSWAYISAISSPSTCQSSQKGATQGAQKSVLTKPFSTISDTWYPRTRTDGSTRSMFPHNSHSPFFEHEPSKSKYTPLSELDLFTASIPLSFSEFFESLLLSFSPWRLSLWTKKLVTFLATPSDKSADNFVNIACNQLLWTVSTARAQFTYDPKSWQIVALRNIPGNLQTDDSEAHLHDQWDKAYNFPPPSFSPLRSLSTRSIISSPCQPPLPKPALCF